ncbi:MAG TPA: UDP-N-acetylglucosamine 2-epimerase (non-hydrolyzing) [candidate division Zixibacteria bacterium]|nr:UDP-N-acetylglucosamine 2-epimerase (non-hydrolyzing) [candidate division Zixibacteria bacterium]
MGKLWKMVLVAGARPNFMKVAPLIRELRCHPDLFEPRLVHTGQHYDTEMSEIFFDELGLPQPDRFLGVGSGSHAEQTARIMVEFEKVCVEDRPDLVVVVGDVNSTMACAITAKKLGIAVAHVEAGLRSRDWTMPEEINRVVTDAVADLLFTTSRDADENLLKEGVAAERIHFVGNVMIDCLLALLPRAEGRGTFERFGVEPGGYATLTLHRPSNVDDPEVLEGIVEVLMEVSRGLPIVWPVHPRARKSLEAFRLAERVERCPGIRLAQPLGYLDMLALSRNARLILTDSGGLQEEATVLRVPCITLRNNTERPVTVECGCNRLAGNDPSRIRAAVLAALDSSGSSIGTPELWDGRAAERIVDVLKAFEPGDARTAEK